MFCPRECHVESLEHASDTSALLECTAQCQTSALLERIAQCQTEYDELCEFTRNEKEIYEEFFSNQVLYMFLQLNNWTSVKFSDREWRCVGLIPGQAV
jgi:hypothetical protein